jgi:hypothetical protein
MLSKPITRKVWTANQTDQWPDALTRHRWSVAVHAVLARAKICPLLASYELGVCVGTVAVPPAEL